jgi:hypothetical protein
MRTGAECRRPGSKGGIPLIQQALQKIQAELAEKPNDTYVQVIGGFLIKHLREHPVHAQQILTDGKTIAGSLAAAKEEARKHQTNGVGVLSDEECFAVVLKYYGINLPVAVPAAAAAPKITTSIDDLL